MFVGYVNWKQDHRRGRGTEPTEYGIHKLRAVRGDNPMSTDSLTVADWGGEWQPQ